MSCSRGHERSALRADGRLDGTERRRPCETEDEETPQGCCVRDGAHTSGGEAQSISGDGEGVDRGAQGRRRGGGSRKMEAAIRSAAGEGTRHMASERRRWVEEDAEVGGGGRFAVVGSTARNVSALCSVIRSRTMS